jgi:hypothetical protein
MQQPGKFIFVTSLRKPLKAFPEIPNFGLSIERTPINYSCQIASSYIRKTI